MYQWVHIKLHEGAILCTKRYTLSYMGNLNAPGLRIEPGKGSQTIAAKTIRLGYSDPIKNVTSRRRRRFYTL